LAYTRILSKGAGNKQFHLPAIICYTTLLVTCFLLSAPAISSNDQNEINEEIESEDSGPALSVNEPVYFAVGGSRDMKARFQFSFKYRIFDQDSWIVEKANWLSSTHFSYTQTSLWNLSQESAPFEDTSYKPSLFWDTYTHKEGAFPAYIRTGVEHESNGQSGDESRSLNTAYVWPFWVGEWHGRQLLLAPKAYAYLSKDDNNRNIEEYRGNVDLNLEYGTEDSWLLASMFRYGGGGRGSVQLDLSYPIRTKIFARTGGYIFAQLFNGYGESLITYDEHQDTQLRIGFAIVR